jgi:hypothetical protein
MIKLVYSFSYIVFVMVILLEELGKDINARLFNKNIPGIICRGVKPIAKFRPGTKLRIAGDELPLYHITLRNSI